MKRTPLLVLLLLAPSAPAQEFPKTLETRPVLSVVLPRATERAARLRPLGMLELPTVTLNNLRLSQLSGLAWDDDEQTLYAISDKGALFHLRPLLRDGRLAGVDVLKAVPLRNTDGKPLKGRRADSEGLDILKGRNGRKGDAELVISFERLPRIARYRPDGTIIGEYPLSAPLNDPRRYRSSNKMLESVCVDEELGVLTLPEAPLADEPAGFNRLFRANGGSWAVPLLGKFLPSAIKCLGNGQVLILERDFGTFTGRAVALRLATLRDGQASATVETVALLDAADGWQIDNFEGLARHQGSRFIMVSDNNDLFLQRTLLLFFEIKQP